MAIDQEKLNAENPLTDENLAFFDKYFKPLDELVELRPAKPQITLHVSKESDEYWEEHKKLMVKTMEESKARTGRF